MPSPSSMMTSTLIDDTGDAQASSTTSAHQDPTASLSPSAATSGTTAEEYRESSLQDSMAATKLHSDLMQDVTSSSSAIGNTVSSGTAQPFRLLDLPDELWIKIGKMIIDELPVTDIEMHGLFEDDETSLNSESFAALKVLAPGVKPPAILQTCSSLRKELRLDYYKSKITVWMHQIPYKKQELVGMYLRSIGADARKQISGAVYGGLVGKAFPTPRSPTFCFEDWEIEVELTAERTAQDWTEHCEYLQWNITFL